MRYCVQCGTEYEEGITDCSDCGRPLVSQAEWDAVIKEDADRRERLRGVEMEKVCNVGGRVEADRLIAALDDDGIPAFVRSFVDTAYDGLWVLQKGWGEIWVDKERLDEARTLIEALKVPVEDEAGEDDEEEPEEDE